MNNPLNITEFEYPNHHIWDYCIPLGKWTDSEGRIHDLGLYVNNDTKLERFKYSKASVCGNEPSDYRSGQLMEIDYTCEFSVHYHAMDIEIYTRAKHLFPDLKLYNREEL